MFYVEINNEFITCKGEGDFKTEEQIEVTQAIYDALVNLPATFTEEYGEIVAVEPIPIPEVILTPIEMRQQAYETNPLIGWQGHYITVDEANTIFLRYFAENNHKATEIQALIVTAKESIREEYPDEVQI